MAQWPRQPRSGNYSNHARKQLISGKYYIQLRNADGSEYQNAFYVNSASRADTIVSRLNSIFDVYPGADLDFITPSYMDGVYVVIWPGVVWFNDSSFSTYTTGDGTTYENIYAGCYTNYNSYTYRSKSNVKLIATVTNDDITAYGTDPWKIALTWANGIRNPINGWNCTKDSTGGNLISGGTIPQLKVPTANYTGTSITRTATFYGSGETQPHFTTANNDIFHTCDLTVAVPSDLTSTLALNRWVKITYGTKSVVARTADICGTTSIDLTAGGVAYALNCYGGGSVQISSPE